MRSLRQLRTTLFLVIAVLLSACVTTPEKSTYADITFRHLAPINLDVGEIKVVNEFRSSLQAPHVEHELPVKIDQSVRRWVQDRLRAVGSSGSYAVVTIKDASVVEKEMPKTQGLKGLFTKDQSELYEFHVAAELQIVNINGAKGLATAEAQRAKSVSEDVTLNDREKMYFEQTEVLMRDFDVEFEKNIRSFLSVFIR